MTHPNPLAHTGQDQVLLLVRGGAEPDDAALTAGVTADRWSEWVADDDFKQRLDAAIAHARTMIDTGQRRQRPGEWQRRTGERSDAPIKIALPGLPLKCAAVLTNGTRPCRNFAMVGTNVCKNHGGAAPQVRAAAARRLRLRNIGALMDRVGHAAETDPLDALMTELHRASVMCEMYAVMANELPLDELERGGNVLLHSLADERDRKTRYAKMAIDAGVAERVVRVQEAQAVMLAQILQSVFADEELGLLPDQRITARRIAAKHLRALPAAAQD